MLSPDVVARTWSTLGSRLASVFHSAVTPYALLSLDHVYVEVNEAHTEMTGRTREECVGLHIFDVFPESQDLSADAPARRLQNSFERAAASGAPDTMPVLRFDVTDENGEFRPRYWRVTNIPILDDAGAAEMILDRKSVV